MLAKYNREWLVETLRNKAVTVTFTKVDGSERRMQCTLMPKFLPEEYRDRGEVLTEASNTISVWDLQADGWRSFRVDSVTSVE